jgi:hypothetical protein
VSAVAEEISPELVLVCPELRERAFQLAVPVWETISREARPCPVVSARPQSRRPVFLRSAGSGLVCFLVWGLATFLAVGCASLTLTLIADSLRSGDTIGQSRSPALQQRLAFEQLDASAARERRAEAPLRRSRP